ncbi:hypothetical protein LMTR13_36545 [Bradyrhizobium icense]|uniref:Uncharacterized protein n=1 Tax=Bradyrhizobium icense TaxID=1274631 RepID=A0A1B1UQ36_9BRAD|nr:hypothetical protein LMTR13_36545 [Bradyrhizobium icense]
MYRRADLWRTEVLVVALLLTAVSTGDFARGFRAADSRNDRYWIDVSRSRPSGSGTEAPEQTGSAAIGFNRTNVALIGAVAPLLVGRLCRVEWI